MSGSGQSNDLEEQGNFEKIKLRNLEQQYKTTTQTSSSKSCYQMPGPKLKPNAGTCNNLKIHSSDEPMQKDSSENSLHSHPLGDKSKSSNPNVDNQENIGDKDLEEYNHNNLLLSNVSAGKKDEISIPKFFKGELNGNNSHVHNSLVRDIDETVIRALENKPVEKHIIGISDNSISSGKAKKKTETPSSTDGKRFKKHRLP